MFMSTPTLPLITNDEIRRLHSLTRPMFKRDRIKPLCRPTVAGVC